MSEENQLRTTTTTTKDEYSSSPVTKINAMMDLEKRNNPFQILGKTNSHNNNNNMKNTDSSTGGSVTGDDGVDMDIIRLREQERRDRAKARDANKQLKIWEKGKRMGQKISHTRKDILKGDFEGDSQQQQQQSAVFLKSTHHNNNISSSSSSSVIATAPVSLTGGSRVFEEKENIHDFIAKKREMFLLQMSLDTKREEIRKIEDRARLKEEALQRSEQMLEEDSTKFDAFLKENDRKAQEALRKAELETKKKMDKVQEIKKLNQEIQAVQTDISKHTEALEECFKYEDFFDSLTNQEWFEKQKILKKERQAQRRKCRIQKRKEEWEKQQQQQKLQREQQESEALEHEGNRSNSETPSKKHSRAAAAARRRRRYNRQQNSSMENMNSSLSDTVDSDKQSNNEKLANEPDFEDEPWTSSDEETPMYFQHPQQLLDIFSEMETESLFMIQNKQESEQVLENLKQKFNNTMNDMGANSASLKQNMSDLRQSIHAERTKTDLCKQSIGHLSSSQQLRDEKMLSVLEKKVKDVYQRCGFDDSGGTTLPTTLLMLSELEAKMEELLVNIAELPPKYTRKAEKDKEKKRRELKRILKLEAQQKAQEERNRKALERSMEPPKKRTTKPEMFRSYLNNGQKVQKKKKEITQDELDEIRHLS